jgi:hypothetical protein
MSALSVSTGPDAAGRFGAAGAADFFWLRFCFAIAAARSKLGVGSICRVCASPSGSVLHPAMRRPHAPQNVAASGKGAWQ